MDLTLNPPRKITVRCGFCADGTHSNCPGGVRNGDGSIVTCPCGCEKSHLMRCTDCSTRDQSEINPATWTCIDKTECDGRLAKARANNPAYSWAQNRQERIEADKPKREPAKPKEPAACLCCGEPTKGGKFLPGHDSRYLSRLQAEVVHARDVCTDEQEIYDKAAAVSPAFLGKLTKRMGDPR